MPKAVAESETIPQKRSTILSLCYSGGLLGAAVYDLATGTVRILHDTVETDEYRVINLVAEQVAPDIVLACKSQDLAYVRYLQEKCQEETKESPTEPPEGTANDPTNDNIEIYPPHITSGDDVVADSQAPSSSRIDADTDEDQDEYDPFKDAVLHLISSNTFVFDKAIIRIGELFSSEVLSKCEADLILQFRLDTKAINMVRAFGALLGYLDAARIGVEYDAMNIRTPVCAIKTFVIDQMIEMDWFTYRALEIFGEDKRKEVGWRKAISQKSPGGSSLFSLMNRCRSSLGKHTLMNWFGYPTLNREKLKERQKAISFFVQDCNMPVTTFIHQCLGKIRNVKMVLNKMRGSFIRPQHWKCLNESLKALRAIMCCLSEKDINLAIMAPFNKYFKESLTEATFLLGYFVDIDLSIAEGRLVVNPSVDGDLDDLKILYRSLPHLLTRIAEEEASRLGAVNCSVSYVPIVGYMLVLPIDFPASMFTDLKMVYTADDKVHLKSKAMNRLDEEMGDIKMQIVDKETNIALRLQKSLLDKSEAILGAYRGAATLDAIISMALTARQFGWSCPILADQPVLEASQSVHPLAQMLCGDRVFIPNNVSSGGDDTKVKIFTGPNACGKSVYMKQVAILAFLAHIGSFVPAQRSIVGPISRIITRVYTVDGVLDGMSTFAKDLQQLALALRRANQFSLVIIDEFGKGTLTEVGLSLLSSSINYWLEKGKLSCPHLMVSSHFHALPKFLKTTSKNVSFQTFEVLKRKNRLDYQFRLVDGLIDCSHAAYTAAQMGIPNVVVQRSNEIYTALRDGVHPSELKKRKSGRSKFEFLADRMGTFISKFQGWNIRKDYILLMKRIEEELLEETEEIQQTVRNTASFHITNQAASELNMDNITPTNENFVLEEDVVEYNSQLISESQSAPLTDETPGVSIPSFDIIAEEKIIEIQATSTSSILKRRCEVTTRGNLSVSFASSPVFIQVSGNVSLQESQRFMIPPSPIKRFNELFPEEQDGIVLDKRPKIH